MSDFLRYSVESGFLQSTEPTVIILGPFISSTDAKTPVTGIEFIEADLQLIKNPENYPSLPDPVFTAFVKSGTRDPWYKDLGEGMYAFYGHDSNTDTLGSLIIKVNKSGCLPYKKTFEVKFQFYADNQFNHSGDGCGVTLYPKLVWSGENRVIGITETAGYVLSSIKINDEDVTTRVRQTNNQDFTKLLGCSNITREEWVVTTFIDRT